MKMMAKIRRTCKRLAPDSKIHEIAQNGLDLSDPLAIREFLIEFEKVMGAHPEAVFGDQESCPLVHKFSPGIYCRQITIPAGTLLIGKIHKEGHPIFLMEGDLSLLSPSGGVQRIKGPASFISAPGAKRLGFAHKQTVWTTVHHNPSNTQDLEKLEAEIIAPTYINYDKYVNKQEVISCPL